MNVQKFINSKGIEKLEAFNAIHHIFPQYPLDSTRKIYFKGHEGVLITKAQLIDLIGEPDELEGKNWLGYYFKYYPDKKDDIRMLFCFNDSTNFMEGILFDGGDPEDQFYKRFNELKWE